MKLRPLYDRVLIQRIEVTESKGGILLPGTVKDRPVEGIVLAIGEGRLDPTNERLMPMTVTVGDKVLIGRHAGVEVEVDREKLVIVNETEILAILG